MDTYAMEVQAILIGFEYELCDECGMDLDAHLIAPFMGHPLVRCLAEGEV